MLNLFIPFTCSDWHLRLRVKLCMLINGIRITCELFGSFLLTTFSNLNFNTYFDLHSYINFPT